MLRCFEGRTRKNRRREISSLLRSLYSFASRHAFLPVFLCRCLRANARIRPRFTGHRAPVAGSNPRPVGQFPFGPFPFLAFAPSIRHAPTRIGNQFRETVINGRERSVVRYVCLPLSPRPFCNRVAIPLPSSFFHSRRSFEPSLTVPRARK